MDKKDILIINQQHTTNIGDKLIGQTMRKLLKGYKIDFAPYIPTEKYESIDNYTVKKQRGKKLIDLLKINTIVNDFLFSIKIKKFLRKKDYQIAVIGGGELLSGNLEFNSALYIWTKYLNRRKIPVIVAGVSGNEVSKRLGKRYKCGLERCKKVYVRDHLTQSILKNQYGLKAEYCPDFVFAFEPENPISQNIHRTVVQIYSHEYVGGGYGNLSKEEYYDIWYRKIQDNCTGSIVLSYSDKDDKKAAYDFKDYVYKTYRKEYEMQDIQSIDDMLALIGNCHTILTGRMHPMILAILLKKHIIPFITKDKIQCFAEEWIDGPCDIKQAKQELEKLKEYITDNILERNQEDAR